MRLAVRVLGEVQVVADGEIVDLGGSRQRRLLAALLVHRGDAVSIDRLVETVFGSDPPDAAWRTFRTYVARLRRAIDVAGADGAEVVVTVPSGYRVPADLDLDASRFEELLQQARRELGDGVAESALVAADAALDLWAGDAYREFASEEWARPEAVRLDELRVVAREVRVAAMVGCGRCDEAIAESGVLIHEHPLREETRRHLMIALYRSGRHAEALRAGRDFRNLLAEETGLDWSRALAELERMILDRDPRLDRVAPGRQLRGYILREELGASPFGVTYRAEQPAVGRDVAVTVIEPALADDADFIRRFEIHAQRLASVEHPNVVPLYDYWREPGGAYFVARYLPGGNLSDRLAGPVPLSEAEAEAILGDVGRALIAMSEHGAAHGQLTTDTVLLDGSGRAHLAGFGVPELDGAAERDISAFADLVDEVLHHARSLSGDGLSDRGAALSDLRQTVGWIHDRASKGGRIEIVVADTLAALRGETVPSVERHGSSRAIEGPNPYRGLHAFRETDAEVFFGREAMVDELASDVRRDSIVVLVGPSGAGKSSVARAGILPRLRESGAYVATMTPGAHPIAELETALSRVCAAAVPDLRPILERGVGLESLLAGVLPGERSRLVLLIDQLEEAVTMADPHERDLVFAGLDRTVRDAAGEFQLVLTARADFLGRLLEHSTLGPMVRDHSRLITPLDSEELYEAIVGPAAAAGVVVEPELATALVADAIDAPGSLPLLEFALTELYEHRCEGAMSLAEYRRMGGLTAPLTRRVEEIFTQLTAAEQQATRRLFTRLITLGEGAEDTRRRVLRSELSAVPDGVLDAFGAARLLTFDRDPRSREPTVEVAHEALIRMWPRLRSWIDDDRAGLLLLRRLTAAADAWERGGREPSELYRGTRLATTDDWSRDHDDDLTPLEREFLEAGRTERDRSVERERRRIKRLRTLIATLAVVAAVAIVAGVVAVVQRGRADDAATDARRQAAIRNVQRLTAESSATVGDDPDLPILLALEAFRRAQGIDEQPPGNLIAALQTAVQSSRLTLSTDRIRRWGAISPDGELLVGGSGTDLVALDARSGDELGRRGTGGDVGTVTFDPMGQRIAAAVSSPDADWILLMDGRSLAIEESLDAPFTVEGGEFSSDGRFLAVMGVQEWYLGPPPILVYNLDRRGDEPIALDEGYIAGWMPNGRTLALERDGEIRFVDVTTDREAEPRMAIGETPTRWGPAYGFVDLTRDGDRLVTIQDRIEVWRVGADEPEFSFDLMAPGEWEAARLAPDGRRLVTYGGINEVRVIDLVDGSETVYGGSSGGSTLWSEFSADGRALLWVSTSGALVFDVSTAGPPELGNLPTSGVVRSIRMTEDGSRAIVDEVDEHSTPNRYRGRAIELSSGVEVWSTPWIEGALLDPGVLPTDDYGLVAFNQEDAPGHVERSDRSVTTTFDPCDIAVAMDPRGRWLALSTGPSRSDDCLERPGRIVDPGTGNLLHAFDGQYPYWGEFGPSGTIADGLLAVYMWPTQDDGLFTIDLLRMPSGEVIGSIVDDGFDFRPLSFSADGRFLTMGSDDSGAWVFDVAAILDGAAMEEAVAMNPRGIGAHATYSEMVGDMLVFGEDGEVLRFYDQSTRTELMALPVDTGRGTMLLPTADDRVLYYMDAEGAMRRFPLDVDELVAIAEQRLQRDFTEDECRQYEIASDCSPFGLESAGT